MYYCLASANLKLSNGYNKQPISLFITMAKQIISETDLNMMV